jgi:hypothetical protein
MTYPNGLAEAIERFLEGVRAKTGASDIERISIETEAGPRYIRVIRTIRSRASHEITSRSAYCFIDKSNGDVLKAAGWKAPAKGARSNIFAADHGLSGVTEYGAVYHYR